MLEDKDKEMEEIFDENTDSHGLSTDSRGSRIEEGADNEGAMGSQDVEKSDKKRKATWIVGILVFGVVVLVLGWLKIKNVIVSPFAGYGPEYWEEEVKEGVTNELLAMQNKDTDKDGLSDYDETYIYKTSMYIEDTDSDGVSDKEEVEGGDDPLCPRGSECYGEIEKYRNKEIKGDEADGFNDIGLEELRRALVEAGMEAEVVESIDDETLLSLYSEALMEMGGDKIQDTSNKVQDTPTIEELEALSAEEIRELLIAGGADEEVIRGIDDETLLEVYLETLGGME